MPKSSMTILPWDLVFVNATCHMQRSRNLEDRMSQKECDVFEIAVDDVFDPLSCKSCAPDIINLGQTGAASARFRSRMLD